MNKYGDLTKSMGFTEVEDEINEEEVEETKGNEMEVEIEIEEEEKEEGKEVFETKSNTPPLPSSSSKFEDTYKIGETTEEVKFQDVTPYKNTGGIEMGENNLIFAGDNFLTGLLDKQLYTTDEDTLSIPLDRKELYKSKVDIENVERIIESAFSSNPKRVSFSLEELGLHNRLIEMGDVTRQFNDFTLIKTDKGNIVVHHTNNSLSDIEKDLMEEAKACLREGKRIIIPLLEDYKFEDGLGLTLERKKFRASFSEIKNFIARTQMKGTITKDAMLVIYE